jgi:hypothetical protein
MADFVEDDENQGQDHETDEDSNDSYQYYDDVDPPELIREISATHLEIPDGAFIIVHYSEIMSMMEKLTCEVATLLSIDKDYCRILLKNYGWNQQTVAEKYFADIRRTLIAVGIQAESVQGIRSTCLICFDDGLTESELFTLSCGHTCCR